jgi:hypothetical protein
MAYVHEVSIEPHPVGKPISLGPGVVPEIRTKITPFYKPIPIGLSRDVQGLGDDSNDTGKKLLVGAAVVGIGALFVWLIVQEIKIRQRIVEKEGAKGLLAFEAGEAGLSLLTHAATMRRNKRRRRRSQK